MEIKKKILNIRNESDLTSTSKEKKAGLFLAKAAEKILGQEDFFDTNSLTVGIEAEFGLVDSNLCPIDEEKRDEIIQNANQDSEKNAGRWTFQSELGASQIEANQVKEAVLSNGFSCNEVLGLFEELEETLQGVTNQENIKVLNLGLHPTAMLSHVVRTSKKKYEYVPNHHKINRLKDSFILKEELGMPEEPDATAVGLSQSLQFNIAAESQEQGLDMLNYMIQMTPSVLAILGNARIAEGVDTGWNDPRNMIWDKTHLTESGNRVLLPEKFFDNVEEVFEHMAKFPLILEPENEFEALQIATGTKWLTGKLKFLTNEELDLEKILVEFRPMSIQQSAQENAAAIMFSVGRLLWSLQQEEPLIDFEDIKENTQKAMKEGLNGEFKVAQILENGDWTVSMVEGEQMRKIELNKAISGLVEAGHGSFEEISKFFEENLAKRSPSQGLIKTLKEKEGLEGKDVKKDILINVLTENNILV